MAYGKGSMPKGKFMDSGSGMCSYGKNPMSAASRVAPMCGPSMGGYANADQAKANKLLQKAQKQQDSLRGKSGM
jgi:hypothetical protein